jgi:hypothetical protein
MLSRGHCNDSRYPRVGRAVIDSVSPLLMATTDTAGPEDTNRLRLTPVYAMAMEESLRRTVAGARDFHRTPKWNRGT